jgi:pilus assembly protein CpaE
MSPEKRLLVVAEGESFLRQLRYHFTQAGYTVDTVQTNAEAIQRLATGTPIAVLCEHAPPAADALQLVSQLRSSPLTRTTPLLVLLYAAAEARGKMLLAAGADECLRRDIPLAELSDRVERAILDGRARQAATPDLPATTTTVLGARGGSGKTMLATNIAVLLAQRPAQTVVLLDLNLEFGTAAMMLDQRPTYSLREIAEAVTRDASDAEFDSLLLRHPSGLRVVPAAGRPGDSELIPEAAIAGVIARLRRLYDHLVVDCRPSFRETMLDLWEVSETLLVTCPPEVISVLLTRSLLDALTDIKISPEKVMVLINQVAPKARLSPEQVEKGLGRSAHRIPYGGEQLYRSVDVGRSFVLERPNDATAQAIRRVAEVVAARRNVFSFGPAADAVSAQAS